jgi:hypothetical protein
MPYVKGNRRNRGTSEKKKQKIARRQETRRLESIARMLEKDRIHAEIYKDKPSRPAQVFTSYKAVPKYREPRVARSNTVNEFDHSPKYLREYP